MINAIRDLKATRSNIKRQYKICKGWSGGCHEGTKELKRQYEAYDLPIAILELEYALISNDENLIKDVEKLINEVKRLKDAKKDL